MGGGGVEPPDRLRQAQALGALKEVQHVAALAAAEAVPALGVGVDREAALGLLMEGADALADAATAAQADARRFHHVAQRVTLLQRRDVDGGVRGDYHEPSFASGRSPRRLRRETVLPACQRILRTASTSSAPPGCGASTAARPVAGL